RSARAHGRARSLARSFEPRPLARTQRPGGRAPGGGGLARRPGRPAADLVVRRRPVVALAALAALRAHRLATERDRPRFRADGGRPARPGEQARVHEPLHPFTSGGPGLRWPVVQTAFVLIDAQPDRIAELADDLAAVDGVA